MAGAGLHMFLTVMEWESWSKYGGGCHLHRVKRESGRSGQMERRWPQVLHVIPTNGTVSGKCTAQLESPEDEKKNENKAKN